MVRRIKVVLVPLYNREPTMVKYWHIMVMVVLITIISFNSGVIVERRREQRGQIRPELHAQYVWGDDDPPIIMDDGVGANNWVCIPQFLHWWEFWQTMVCHKHPQSLRIYEKVP